MAYWLLKTEPSEFSFDDLASKKNAVWDGVSNAAALINLRAMKAGDEVLVYHTGKEKAVVGTGRVSKAAYPDPKQKNEKLVVVEIRAGERLARPVTLAQIKAEKSLKDWELVKIGRLSVVPTTAEQWKTIMRMAAE